MTTHRPERPDSGPFERRLRELCRLWGAEELAPSIRVELSTRMTRSLGRAYPERRLIRIATVLRQGPAGFMDEVLCHEAAHLAVFHLHGRSVRPHGPEWKSLVRAAGFEPSTRLRVPEGIPRPPRVVSIRRRRRRRTRLLPRWARVLID